jgi:hypothetical protein
MARIGTLWSSSGWILADQNVAFGKQILDVAEAHGEAKVGPDGVLDDVRREAESLETKRIYGHGL